MKLKNLFALVMLVQVAGAFALAEEYTDYDSIVRELSSTRTAAAISSDDSFEVIRFHAGVSLITSRLFLDLPKGLPRSTNLQGVEARLGIDLFTPSWTAEGAVRSFSPDTFQGGEISAREFDLLVLHHLRPGSKADVILGGGMGARYVNISGSFAEQFPRSSSTPVSIFMLGFSSNVTPNFVMGGDISYRSALVSDSADENSFDAGFRVGGRF